MDGHSVDRNDQHYAILVAINLYPGLSNLDGPVNDAQAFHGWLTEEAGGNVPEDNIELIISDEVVADPDDANPTEAAFRKALNKLTRKPGGLFKQWVGQRLYLFMAGHGFTAGSSLSDPALYTAAAQFSDNDHIAAYRYAAKIVSAGFFDEVVLIMDCCQDVLKASTVIEPTWSPTDQSKAASVRFLQAYGAPRGRKTFEQQIGPEGQTRGLFSTALLEALRSADADADGWVTGRSLRDRLFKQWRDNYLPQLPSPYDPVIRLPDADDIRLYQRGPVAAGGFGAHVKARLDQQAGALGRLNDVDSSMLELVGGETADAPAMPAPSANPPPTPTSVNFSDEMGSAAPPGSRNGAAGGDSVSEPPGAALTPNIEFISADAGLDIVVLDHQEAFVSAGVGRLELSVRQGAYTALVRAPGAVTSRQVQVTDDWQTVRLAGPAFACAAPLPGTAHAHPDQAQQAFDASAVPSSTGCGDAELFVFIRDFQRRHVSPPSRLPVVEVVSFHEESVSAVTLTVESVGTKACAWAKTAVMAGVVGLASPMGNRTRQCLAVPALDGWRTDVYLAVHEADDGGDLQLDLAQASVFLVPQGLPSPVMSQDARAAEIARLRLRHGGSVVVPTAEQVAVQPLWAVYAAYGALQSNSSGAEVQRCLNLLPEKIRGVLPDTVLLDLWCAGATIERSPLAFCVPGPLIPLLDAGWSVMAKLHPNARVTSAIETVGQWRLGGSGWTFWKQVGDFAPVGTAVSPLKFRGALSEIPCWNVEEWKSLAPGLRTRVKHDSPFKQALRRAILDAVSEEDPQSPVPRVANAFGLPPDMANRAYADLYRRAQEALRGEAVSKRVLPRASAVPNHDT